MWDTGAGCSSPLGHGWLLVGQKTRHQVQLCRLEGGPGRACVKGWGAGHMRGPLVALKTCPEVTRPRCC